MMMMLETQNVHAVAKVTERYLIVFSVLLLFVYFTFNVILVFDVFTL